jgi:hypothetical protein
MPDSAPNMEAPKTPEISEGGVDLSSAEADRREYEQSAEHEDAILHAEAGDELKAAQATHAQPAPPSPSTEQDVSVKDEIVIEVEKILEEGIGPFYASLPPEAKPIFKKRGEEVAAQIAEMVKSFHFRIRRAVRLIADWLRTIPGVNKFFLEQEAKIKADLLKQLVEARREDAERNV